MNMNIEEQFNKDLSWLLCELKQEEMANAYSQYKIQFRLVHPSDESEPTLRSQRRLLKMLSSREAVTLKPFFHTSRRMSILDDVFEMQGAEPVGYYIQILQPAFDKILEEVTEQEPIKVEVKVLAPEALQSPDANTGKYFVSVSRSRKVMLNNTFVLSSPNFNTENHQFIEYVIEHEDEKLTRDQINTDANIELKKSFHSTLGDLGFKGEIRKLFFEASKDTVLFRNNVPENELEALEINVEKLNGELAGLERNGQKDTEEDGDSEEVTE
jgi:hypothetical protein